ncbi:MAG: hypothetical protein JJE39_16790 [Vicinamibacteria bacterium]|nr:hypothetical protein [Vicinamibacteria bacterium]
MHSKRKLFIFLVAVVATFGAIAVALAQEGQVESSPRAIGEDTDQPFEGPRSGSTTGARIGILHPRPMRKSASATKVLRLPPLAWPRRI